MDKLLHTPEGVRDIYNSECARKMQLEQIMQECMHLYGFHDIQTPMFEFFDIFNKERGTVASKDMYKFFDREGNTLVLRPDITPSIARCVTKYYREEELPIRLCYCGSTFINNSSYQGKLKESTQLGAELINDASVEADAEMIALTVECLKKVGLEEFLVEIGQADFFNGLMEEAKLEEEEVEQLRILIENKNMFGVEELLQGKKIEATLKEVILQLPQLFGTIDKIKAVKETLTNKRAVNALLRLERLYELLECYGYEKYITFDLGMLSKYNYYTGIIFRAMTYGTGDAIITGGRYDSLVGQFGKVAPAIGMAILVDSLMTAMSRQKLNQEFAPENTLILYHDRTRTLAIGLAKHFRAQNMKIEMLIYDEKRSIQEYVAYAKRSGIGGILHLLDQEKVDVINAVDDTTQQADISQLMQ
ncbi:MAG: ATP phosphoribosyltransferase regulatory subunit [Clostridiales bacterium]|nr:ATP phosphoribosyltransferase regulatory subunit [Clostridiales bacterium]